ncbi:MAG: rhodanese-like domain-containing protein, partial [Lachnospiraceae bacterium]|nr:rhodanese-like domain-containing protein [Lachnospiraceae bacterium]
MEIMNGSDITLGQVQNLSKEEYIMIDIRDEIAFAHGHIPDAKNVLPEQIMSKQTELPFDKKIIVCCKSGLISKDAAAFLVEDGYEAYNLQGGYQEWLLNSFLEEERFEEIEKSLR